LWRAGPAVTLRWISGSPSREAADRPRALGGSRMPALISAVVTLINLFLSLAIGLRLYRVAWREGGFGPEFWLAGFFLFAAFLGAGLNISVYVGMAEPSLAMNAFQNSLVLMASGFSYCVGTAGLHMFVWLAFRRESKRARSAAAVGSLAVFIAAGIQA